MRSTVPMLPQLSAGSVAKDYLNLARQFQAAATKLSVAYVNGQINWPNYLMSFHASELALKAYCKQFAPGVSYPKHKLRQLAEIAGQHGLILDADTLAALDELEVMHNDHWARYPDSRSGPIRDVSQLAAETVETLIRTISARMA